MAKSRRKAPQSADFNKSKEFEGFCATPLPRSGPNLTCECIDPCIQTWRCRIRDWRGTVRFSHSIVVVWIVVVDCTTAKVCENDTLKASCPSGTLLMIVSARYMMAATRNCELGYRYVFCVADVVTYVKQRCDGRRGCNMMVGEDLIRYVHKRYPRQRKPCLCELNRSKESIFFDVTY